MLGHTAGQNMWIGMLGFALTGILLPFITVIVVAFYDEGVESVGNRIHPWFGFIFAVVIYMSIGHFTVFHVLQMSRTKLVQDTFYLCTTNGL